jgi:hypothetical protein
MKIYQRKKFPIFFVILFSTVFFSCSERKNEKAVNAKTAPRNTTDIINSFVYGLWSHDTGNVLTNEGYYFKTDGSVDLVASDQSATWELSGTDSIKIEYSDSVRPHINTYRIDSLNENRMILSDETGNHLFRKVPFGSNETGTVMEGYNGELERSSEKRYSFTLPAAKKIQLILRSENPQMSFRVFDGKTELTGIPVRLWTAIMIRSGTYTLVLSTKDKSSGQYDMRVMGF